MRTTRKIGCLILLGLGFVTTGCKWQFFAMDPEPGDLKGQWLVNEAAKAELSLDSPLVAHLRLRNEFPRRLRMVDRLKPRIEGRPELQWKAYSKLPRVLEPGENWEGVWLLSDSLEVGNYQVETEGTEIIASKPAEVVIQEEPLPAPVRTQNQCLVARLTGEVDQISGILSAEIEAGLAPPSTHLQLAELLESTGNPDGARQQYELFAEKVYGVEALPAWLRSKMTIHEEE